MAKNSVVGIRYIKNEEIRLDAYHYSPEYLEVVRILSKIKTVPLYKIGDIFDGPFGSEVHSEEYVPSGIPFLRVSDIEPFFVNMKKLVCIPIEKHRQIIRSKIKPGYVVITKTGTIGISAVVPPEIKEGNIRADLAGIKLKKSVNPYYLCAFLNSKYGYFQVLRFRSSTRPRILIENLRKIRIPILPDEFQSFIEQLIQQAYEKRKLAEQKYKQAEELLYKILGITKEEIEKLEEEKGYETNFKNVAEAFRFDAEYYHPKYLGVIELLEKNSF